MKIQVSVWIVTVLLVLAAGLVYALSVTPSPEAQTVRGSGSGASVSKTELAARPTESLSPVLTQADAFGFLDPVPEGRKAPDFSTVNAEGKVVRMQDFIGKKNLVVVFYQGSFCPVCGHQLSNLQENLSNFKAQDAEIIAVSADDPLHALNSVGEYGLTFNVVPDQDKKLIKAFGVANISKKSIAWPALFVIDKKGVVRLSFANREGHRMQSNEILPVLSKITGKPSPRVNYE